MTKIPKNKPVDNFEERLRNWKRYFHQFWKN